MRRVLLLLGFVLAGAVPCLAGFKTEVTLGPGFKPGAVSKVVVVSTECHEALDCRRIEREVAAELTRAQPEIAVSVGDSVYSELLRTGNERYTTDLRESIAKAFEADSILELSAPHAAPGMATVRRSEVKLTLRLVRPTGEILFLGEGTGRPKNTLSSPEKAAGEVAERVFERFSSGEDAYASSSRRRSQPPKCGQRPRMPARPILSVMRGP